MSGSPGFAEVVALVRDLHAQGLRLRRDRATYTSASGILRWRAVDPGVVAVTVECWSKRADPAERWTSTAKTAGARVEVRRGVTVGGMRRLLVALGVLSEPTGLARRLRFAEAMRRSAERHAIRADADVAEADARVAQRDADVARLEAVVARLRAELFEARAAPGEG